MAEYNNFLDGMPKALRLVYRAAVCGIAQAKWALEHVVPAGVASRRGADRLIDQFASPFDEDSTKHHLPCTFGS